MDKESSILPIVQDRLALDTPQPPYARGTSTRVFGEWERRLRQAGFIAHCLPHIPYEIGLDELVEETERISRAVLSSAGGLVVAHSEIVFELDRSVLTHIEQAAELEVPVFMQVPLEETMPSDAEVPTGEIILTGFRTTVIRDRLERGT